MEEKNVSASLAHFATTATNFMADRRGVPIILGLILVLLNFCLPFFPPLGWFVEYDVLLHLGVLIAVGGILFGSTL